ncbi:uncharacterized protein LOC127874181 [Dreissena polymorpha]|uniref:uncharacterized protein LOC127874181 n=1 Tax=Dreissena polymorpha TaxID=45954 RepID=UPI0022655345|nr:uncharacterized protein LOC127874181 [Dreissena polymorpha]
MLPDQPNQTYAATKCNDSCQSGAGNSKEIVHSAESSLSVCSFNERHVDKHVWDSMPPELKVAYIDVLILYHENDQQNAAEFRDHLVNDIQLKHREKVRALLYDEGELIALNNRKIGQLSDAMNRSTYVFIYLTKEFVKDKWMEFTSEVFLMEAIENPDKQWCVVPVFTEKRNGTFKIPTGLNILNGLNYYNKDQYYLKQVTCLIESRIQSRKKADVKLINMQKVWISNQEKTTSASYSETNNELSDFKSSKPCKTQDKMCYSNEDLTLLTDTPPNVNECFGKNEPETEWTEHNNSELRVSTISTLHCDMAMSSPMPKRSDSTNLPTICDKQSYGRSTAEQKRTNADAYHLEAGNMNDFTDEVRPHSPPSRYSDQAAEHFEPHSKSEFKDQRNKGKKRETMKTDDSLYQPLTMISFDESGRSISVCLGTANGGENQTQSLIVNTLGHEQSRSVGGQYCGQTYTNDAAREAALIPQFETLLHSGDIGSYSGSGNQSKPCPDNIAENVLPQTTDVNQNEYLNIQGALPLLSDFEIGPELHNTENERHPRRHEPIYCVHESEKINRQAAEGSSPIVHYHKTVINIHRATNIQIGDQNMILEANDSDDECNSNYKESQTHEVTEEEMHQSDNRNGELLSKRELEVGLDKIHDADDDHMNSSLKSVPASDAQLFTDNVCKDEADANRAVRDSSFIDTSVKEDCNLQTEDTTQNCEDGASEQSEHLRRFAIRAEHVNPSSKKHFETITPVQDQSYVCDTGNLNSVVALENIDYGKRLRKFGMLVCVIVLTAGSILL